MKVKTYMRVGWDAKRRKAQVVANTKPSGRPLRRSDGEPLPTVAFAVELDLPDELFTRAERVIAMLSIPPESAVIAAEVTPKLSAAA
jgi:hypothetical protein